MENDAMMAECRVRPRRHEEVRDDIVAQMKAYPSFAMEAVYAKPVGADPDTGRQKIARNLSIRAAEAIAAAYGYCRIRTEVTPVDDDTVRVEATFVDYQSCRVWQDTGLLSKNYKSRKYGMKRWDDERFFNVVVKAEMSRRIREVICRSVPPGLRSELRAMAEREAGKLLDDKHVAAIVAKYGTLGVNVEQLEAYLGKTQAAGWTEADRVRLLGTWNALSDGETTVEEAFGNPDADGDALAAQLSEKAAKSQAKPKGPPPADAPQKPPPAAEQPPESPAKGEGQGELPVDDPDAFSVVKAMAAIANAESKEAVTELRKQAEVVRATNEITGDQMLELMRCCADREKVLSDPEFGEGGKTSRRGKRKHRTTHGG
jgi:hypothetical protein